MSLVVPADLPTATGLACARSAVPPSRRRCRSCLDPAASLSAVLRCGNGLDSLETASRVAERYVCYVFDTASGMILGTSKLLDHGPPVRKTFGVHTSIPAS